uniref:ABC transporter substrate-binding protein n=1 Tax=Magnetococcus massalia (strain MO-1) TaxID=451514 RepID=A0A1S7LGT3_MAGMO|nr:Conserved protein of unknown function. ABC transporter substrate binding protein [Candidatus Magnetococcus massalia]
MEGFKAQLRELGYRDGKEVSYLFEGAAASIAELEPMAKRLLAEKPDLIFASTTLASKTAKRVMESARVPVVFAPVNDPVAAGIVSQIKRPGEHVTGVRLGNSDPKRLEWLVKVDPAAKRILIPFNAKDSSALTSLQRIRGVADQLGVLLVERSVTRREQVTALINQPPEEIDAIFLPRDGLVMSRIKDFVKMATAHKLSLSTPRYKQVEAGAVMGYGFTGYALGRQAARLADQILRGAKPGDLPVETGEDYLFINQRTAKEIGLKVPVEVLKSAYKVIE